jgi:hypothetical protein
MGLGSGSGSSTPSVADTGANVTVNPSASTYLSVGGTIIAGVTASGFFTGSTNDQYLTRGAAKVMVLDSWLQTGGLKRVSANVTNATATMANITDLTVTLQAGRKYAGQYSFIAKNSTAAEGLQFDLAGGAATFTSIEFMFRCTPPGVTLGTTVSAAAGTALTATTATATDVVYTIYFNCVCNAAGTLIPRFAEVSHTTGTATILLGSIAEINDFA